MAKAPLDQTKEPERKEKLNAEREKIIKLTNDCEQLKRDITRIDKEGEEADDIVAAIDKRTTELEKKYSTAKAAATILGLGGAGISALLIFAWYQVSTLETKINKLTDDNVSHLETKINKLTEDNISHLTTRITDVADATAHRVDGIKSVTIEDLTNKAAEIENSTARRLGSLFKGSPKFVSPISSSGTASRCPPGSFPVGIDYKFLVFERTPSTSKFSEWFDSKQNSFRLLQRSTMSDPSLIYELHVVCGALPEDKTPPK